MNSSDHQCGRGSVRRISTLLGALILLPAGWLCSASDEPDDGRVVIRIRAQDPNNEKLSFSWKQIEGPTIVVADPTAARVERENNETRWVSETYFVAKEPGQYAFEVTVKNEDGVESKATVRREVKPPVPPPTAIAGKDQTKTEGELVVLNAIDSRAAEGQDITKWEWKVTQAPEGFSLDEKKLAERQVSFTAKQSGTYQFELKVFDGHHWSAPSQTMLTIKRKALPPHLDNSDGDGKATLPAPPPPVSQKNAEFAAIVKKGKNVKAGDTITLDGTASKAPEDSEFFWQQKKGPRVSRFLPDQSKPFNPARHDPLNCPVWTCIPEQPGEYTFTLEITAKKPGGKDGETIKVESEPVEFVVAGADGAVVVEPPVPPPPPDTNKPTAELSADKSKVEAGDVVTLDASKSKAASGGKLEYLWRPVEGKRYPRNWIGQDGPQVQFRADEEGDYAVGLVVIEGTKRSDPAEISVSVLKAAPIPGVKLKPTYEAVVDQELTIRAEIDNPEKKKIKWTCISPPDLKIPDDFSHNSALRFKPKRAIVYVFKIDVTDEKGRTVSAQTQVGANEPGNLPPTAMIEGPKEAKAGQKLKLSGERSKDPEGKALHYTWLQESGPKIPGAAPAEDAKIWEFTPSEPGRYVVTLTVSDGVSNSAPERFAVNVVQDEAPVVPLPPVAGAPVAKITGPESGKIAVGETAFLDGSASKGPAKTPLTFKWRKAEGPGDIEISGADTPKASITARAPGAVRVELIVSTADGNASEPAALTLAVTAERPLPIARIGGETTGRVGADVELSGLESSVTDGKIANFIWSQPTDGGPDAHLRSSALRKPTIRFTPERPGTYIFNLVVMTAEGTRSEPAEHKIVVKGPSRPPRAQANKPSPEVVMAGGEVKLSAHGSIDPNGGALTYRWKQVSGPALKLPDDGGETISVVPAEAGEYVVECLVSNADGEAPARFKFGAKAPNHPPVAAIKEIVPCEPGEKVVLDATDSKDPDGDSLEYKWTRVAGPSDVNFGWRGDRKPKVEATLPKEGEYVFELKVFDGKEWSEPVRAAVRTRAANQPPVAAVTRTDVRAEVNIETVLDASPSSDPDNGPKPLTFTWRQTRGRSVDLHAEGAIAKFTPRRADEDLAFEVVAFDGKSKSAPAVVRVKVLKAGVLPIASAKVEKNPVQVAQRGVPNQPIGILNGTDSKGNNLVYAWTQIGGEDLRLRERDLMKSRIGIAFYQPGIYRFRLVVTDADNNVSQPSEVEVKVIDAPAAGDPAEDKGAGKKSKDGAMLSPPASQSENIVLTSVLETERPNEPEDGALLPPPKDISCLLPASDKQRMEESFKQLALKQDRQSEQTLIHALSNSNPEIRGAAAAAISDRGINGIPVLIAVLESGDAVACNEASSALRELTSESLGKDAARWKAWWAKQPVSHVNAEYTGKN